MFNKKSAGRKFGCQSYDGGVGADAINNLVVTKSKVNFV